MGLFKILQNRKNVEQGKSNTKSVVEVPDLNLIILMIKYLFEVCNKLDRHRTTFLY